MRAIIIQDHDARALLDQLKLESFGDVVQWARGDEWHALPEGLRKELADNIHRKFHYIVTRWLQEQGCQIVR